MSHEKKVHRLNWRSVQKGGEKDDKMSNAISYPGIEIRLP
jgi:hypothetical protein